MLRDWVRGGLKEVSKLPKETRRVSRLCSPPPTKEAALNTVRVNRAVAAVALLYGVLALLLPQSAVEVLGVPLVVAGAYFGGVRGGLLTALWAILVTTVSFFVLHDRRVTTR